MTEKKYPKYGEGIKLLKNRTFVFFLSAFAHFLTDFVCTAMLTVRVSQTVGSYSTAVVCAVIYNGAAFALQLPAGAFADSKNVTYRLSAAGMVITALSFLLPSPSVFCAAAGIGNALFHAGAGRASLIAGKGRAYTAGVFVAPGALGIFAGPLAAKHGTPLWLCCAALFLLAIPVFLLGSRDSVPRISGEKKASLSVIAAVTGCMFLTVFLRSYMGSVLTYPFKSGLAFSFLFTLCIFAGKFVGGFLSDKTGLLRCAVGTQTLCVILFVLASRFQFAAMPAILLFNTTMAVTVTVLFRLCPAYPGTMFGLTTLALFLGTLPKHLGLKNLFLVPHGPILLSGCSAVLFLTGLLIFVKGKSDDTEHSEIADRISASDASV